MSTQAHIEVRQILATASEAVARRHKVLTERKRTDGANEAPVS